VLSLFRPQAPRLAKGGSLLGSFFLLGGESWAEAQPWPPAKGAREHHQSHAAWKLVLHAASRDGAAVRSWSSLISSGVAVYSPCFYLWAFLRCVSLSCVPFSAAAF